MVDSVEVKLVNGAAAIVATETEIAIYIDDSLIVDDKTYPHVAKLNLAMLFLNEIERHADWFRRGIHLIDALKREREKKE